jgi:hypothetical protein
VGDRRAQQGAALTVGAAGVGGFRLRKASSSVRLMKLLSCGSSWAIRASRTLVSSSEENFLSASPRAISARVN